VEIKSIVETTWLLLLEVAMVAGIIVVRLVGRTKIK
jgi:hypothetical protein